MASVMAAVLQRELVLGRYRLVSPLGSGSSGSVWLCRDEHTGMDAALKIVARDGRAPARAKREASIAMALKHPRCLRAYGVLEDERNVYIVYEYVAGRTLRELLRAGELTDRFAVEAAAQVLEALAHAHARGIVHRDVKPANVLVAEDEGTIRLFDFGLAQSADSEALTAVGDIPGTLAYIAPERLHGATGSPAGDVWSVGVMLWEALARRHPFCASSLVATAGKIDAGASPLASARPDLPKGLVRAVDRALSVDPARRPSAGALANALSASTAPPPPVRLPVPSTPELSFRAASNRLVPAAFAALVAGWVAATFPFYPVAWPLVALAAAATSAWRPRAGLALALAIPILPLGNLSLGAALAYGVLAAGWLALFAREPRSALGFGLGPLLAPLGALGLLPLLLLPVRGMLQRGALAAAAVGSSALLAGLHDRPLPFTGERTPTVGLAGLESPFATLAELGGAVLAMPAIGWQALVLGAAAAVFPIARRRGLLVTAAFGAVFLALALLPFDEVSVTGPVVTTWLACIGVALLERRRRS